MIRNEQNTKLQHSIFFLLVILSLFIAAPAKADANSSELRQVTSVDGNVERIDYIDQNGVVTFAADKHYATIIKTKKNNTVLEAYFDEAGAPAKQSSGHYALLREYDDQERNYKTTYLDIDGQPMVNSSGYSILVRSYSRDGTIIEHYYDPDGDPTATDSGYYGRRNIYEHGRNTVTVYLDEKEQPVKNKSGYAIIKRSYYEEGAAKGKVESEFYFDEFDAPVELTLGQFGVHKEYDALGRTAILTYLDEDGEPTVTKLGYTTVKKSFFPNNKVETEMYFGLEGEPVALSNGQYGVKHIDGRLAYLDINGKEMFDLKNYLYTHPRSVVLIAVVVVIVSAVCGKRVNAVLLPFYLFFIAYMTLMYRTGGKIRAEMELFWSYKQFFSSASLRLEILNNIWLFVPLGAILCRLRPHISVLMIPVFISILIEVFQYFTGYGLCEFDDVISNSLGALIGFVLGYGLSRLRSCKRGKKSVKFSGAPETET